MMKTFRVISNAKQLQAAMAEGWATVRETNPFPGARGLVDAYVFIDGQEGGKRILMSRRSAATLGLAVTAA